LESCYYDLVYCTYLLLTKSLKPIIFILF